MINRHLASVKSLPSDGLETSSTKPFIKAPMSQKLDGARTEKRPPHLILSQNFKAGEAAMPGHMFMTHLQATMFPTASERAANVAAKSQGGIRAG